MLKINNLCKSFGSAIVLNNVSLEVEANVIVGLAGSSGSGKSTLLRIIQKLENEDSGYIKCDHQIGFMFQDFQLFPHMTALENLVYAPNLKYKKSPKLGMEVVADQNTKSVKNESIENKAKSYLQNLGILDKANIYPHNLSGGQKQRVALARSLMMCPGLLLCDEPTSGLDFATIDDIVSLIKSVKNGYMSMLIASHDLDFLTKIADRIVILKNGSITQDVNPRILKDPINDLKKYY